MVNRVVDVVIGMQAGSEGKGKIVSQIAHKYKALVRTGGPNAAHTVYYEGKPAAFHQIPCGSLHAPDALLVLGANAQIDIEYLKKEIDLLKKHNRWLDSTGKPRLVIDAGATIIDTVDKVAENGGRMPDCGDLWFHPRDCDTHNANDTCMGCPKLPKDSAWAKLGSTTHGGGANSIRKAMRGTKIAILPGQEFDHVGYASSEHKNWYDHVKVEPVRLACEDEFLKQFVGPTVHILNQLIDDGQPIMLEGTQGAMLSLHHSYWPKATSRDTNAGNWIMEAGISPLAVRDIYGVARTFPIRVAGNSGPLSGTEIDWDEVTEHATGFAIKAVRKAIENLSGRDDEESKQKLEELNDQIAKKEIVEITTATKRKRRVFLFGEEDFEKATLINRPTINALTFVDYLNIEDFGKSSWDSLSQQTRDWITTLESKLGVFFNFLSTGPKQEHSIIRKSPGELAAEVQTGS